MDPVLQFAGGRFDEGHAVQCGLMAEVAAFGPANVEAMVAGGDEVNEPEQLRKNGARASPDDGDAVAAREGGEQVAA